MYHDGTVDDGKPLCYSHSSQIWMGHRFDLFLIIPNGQ